MAKNYKIQFVSLRAGTTYVLNIGGGSGSAVQLTGSTSPFTTDEDGTEDMFVCIRTQTGYIRVFDNGRDYDGHVLGADWWKDMIPVTDSARPVTLTANGSLVWQGFMQSQTFSGHLYGNPQEREFPVICPLGILTGKDININAGLRNFAYLLKNVCDTIDDESGNVVHISSVYVQGGVDARRWLRTKIDWQNFAAEDSGTTRSKYSLYDVLEDMCRFWGWTARTYGTSLYLTCADDTSEPNFLSLTRSELDTLAAASDDTTTGIILSSSTVTLSDDSNDHLFASTDIDDYQIQGPHRAVVKGDCNEHDTVVKFAPKDIETYMGDAYSWIQGDGDLVGYFTTDPKRAYDIGEDSIKVTTGNHGRISRRQIYQSAESENAVVGDMLMVLPDHISSSPSVQLQTLRPMTYGGGSISLGGTAWMGAVPLQHDKNKYTLRMRLGIGMSRDDINTKWWYMNTETTPTDTTINYGWSQYPSIFNVPLSGNTLKSTGTYFTIFIAGSMYIYPAIPVPADTYGYIFIDIMGAYDYGNGNEIESFEIANFEIKYSRDTYDIPSSPSVIRPRELITKRVTSREYTAVNTNDSKDEWNANCIFASDNNMEYGYGLLLDSKGNIIEKVGYGSDMQHPEQHLASRVADYWATAKRKIEGNFMASKTAGISPLNRVAISGENDIFAPVAISHDWHDDITRISLLQI